MSYLSEDIKSDLKKDVNSKDFQKKILNKYKNRTINNDITMYKLVMGCFENTNLNICSNQNYLDDISKYALIDLGHFNVNNVDVLNVKYSFNKIFSTLRDAAKSKTYADMSNNPNNLKYIMKVIDNRELNDHANNILLELIGYSIINLSRNYGPEKEQLSINMIKLINKKKLEPREQKMEPKEPIELSDSLDALDIALSKFDEYSPRTFNKLIDTEFDDSDIETNIETNINSKSCPNLTSASDYIEDFIKNANDDSISKSTYNLTKSVANCPGWNKVNRGENSYYYNVITKETSWTNPCAPIVPRKLTKYKNMKIDKFEN